MSNVLRLCENIERAFEVLGRRWSGLIIELLLQRPARFSELTDSIPGISDRILSSRLRDLQRAGLVNRQVNPGPPVSVTYSLTEHGEGLRPVMESLRAWAATFAEAAVPLRST